MWRDQVVGRNHLPSGRPCAVFQFPGSQEFALAAHQLAGLAPVYDLEAVAPAHHQAQERGRTRQSDLREHLCILRAVRLDQRGGAERGWALGQLGLCLLAHGILRPPKLSCLVE